ncbi:hypothetical protein [Streptomyces sp. NPDC048603]|uniref:hypothetical protein n=1 Tax=Streptomyces sp. NPDC048603 TaxID=3365577 RepID=UPI00371D3E6A
MNRAVGSDGQQPRRGRFEAVHLWVTTLTSVVALAISLYSFNALRRQPEVDVTLPHLVRFEPRGPGGEVHLFIQPTVSSRIRTEDVEIITDAALHLRPSDQAVKPPRFFWDESGAWKYDHASNGLNYERLADPTPLVVGQHSPQQPTLLFNARGWSVKEGRYEGVLELHRATRRKPIERPFCLDISAQDVAIFAKAPERDFFELRNDAPEGRADHTGCYHSRAATAPNGADVHRSLRTADGMSSLSHRRSGKRLRHPEQPPREVQREHPAPTRPREQRQPATLLVKPATHQADGAARMKPGGLFTPGRDRQTGHRGGARRDPDTTDTS